MATPDEEAKYNEARFLALVSGLSSTVMQHLGKVINPLTGQVERDLQAAKGTIDLLVMLKEKTKGNLSDRENRTLNALLSSLQLNYVDELKAETEKPKEQPEEKAAEAAAEEPHQAEKEKPEEEPDSAGHEEAEQPPAGEDQPPEQQAGK
jgi:hypothetical protein